MLCLGRRAQALPRSSWWRRELRARCRGGFWVRGGVRKRVGGRLGGTGNCERVVTGDLHTLQEVKLIDDLDEDGEEAMAVGVVAVVITPPLSLGPPA
jgi:hypothetical protein